MGSQLPGDIAWTPGHVGLYIGGGQMIEAQTFGTTVMVSPVRVSAFVRFW
jgi:cell wall-associated NlpC family hydrolase